MEEYNLQGKFTYNSSDSDSKMYVQFNVVYVVIHSFHWHVQNLTIPCHSQELLPFLSVMYFLLPPFFHPLSSHLAISFLGYLSVLLFPNSCII
jgi:hypothetical protein